MYSEQPNLVPQDIHMALDDFVQAHRALLRYFFPRELSFQYLGDTQLQDYLDYTDTLYDTDTSDNAALLIQDAKRLFQVYSYKRSQIGF
jgi:hypothetical protein